MAYRWSCAADALDTRTAVPLAKQFGPMTHARGGTIAFYLLAPDGMPYDVRAIEAEAHRARISLRTGCFCNPGDGEVAHGITREDMAKCFIGACKPVSFEDCAATLRTSTGKAPNTMRVSLGLASNFRDAYALIAFAERFRDMPGDLAA
jgi:selenocysteine lyase/cysteine desulfurase